MTSICGCGAWVSPLTSEKRRGSFGTSSVLTTKRRSKEARHLALVQSSRIGGRKLRPQNTGSYVRRARLPRARALVRDPALVRRALGRRARRRARDAARVARGRAARALRPVRASKAVGRARAPSIPPVRFAPGLVVLVVVVVSLSLSGTSSSARRAAATTCSASRGRTTPARRSCTAR